LVFRGATFLSICLLVCFMGVEGVNHRVRTMNRDRAAPAPAAAPVPQPAQFKQQAKTEAMSEATAKANLARTEQQLNNEMKMLDLQQQQVQLLSKLKATHEAREKAERELVHHRLLAAQAETARLVHDLESSTTSKLLMKLQKLNDIIATAMIPHKKSTTAAAAAAKPTSIAIDTKLKQKMKEDPAAPTNGVESAAKKALHKKLVNKATEVVNAQLDGILNSEELAYIKAHNDLGDSDQAETADGGDIVEQDTGALPGESPDEHFNRLSKEADALMAKAYPFIKCEGAGGSSGGSSTGEGNSTATGESSTVEGSTGGNSTETVSAETAASTGATGESTAGGTGLLEAGATTESGTAAPSTTGEAATAAPPATAAAGATAESSTGETPAAPVAA